MESRETQSERKSSRAWSTAGAGFYVMGIGILKQNLYNILTWIEYIFYIFNQMSVYGVVNTCG